MKKQRIHTLRLEVCEPRHLLAVGVLSEVAGPGDPAATSMGTAASAAEAGSIDNLTTITTAILNYESARRHLPAHAIYSRSSGEPLLSWRVSILPYLGYNDLYHQFRLDEPWDSPHNRELLKPMPPEFRAAPTSPISNSPPVSPAETVYQVVVGPGTVFPAAETRIRWRDIPDGVSNTVFLIETDAAEAVPWTKPQDIQFDPGNPLHELGDPQRIGLNVALGTTEPLAVPRSVDPELWTRLVLRDDGQFVDLNQIAPPLGAERSLRELTLAALNHESALRYFPAPAIYADDGQPLLSWRVSILPFIEQQNLYDQFHLDEPWDSPHNLSLLPLMPRVFAHEGVPIGLTNFLVFVGDDTAFPIPEGPRINQGLRTGNFPDGLSDTILFAQANSDFAAEWTRPQDIAYDPLNPLRGVGNIGPDEFFVSFADGHVEAIPNNIRATLFHRLVTRNDGLPTEPFTEHVFGSDDNQSAAIPAPAGTTMPVSMTPVVQRSRADSGSQATPWREPSTGHPSDKRLFELVFERYDLL